MWTFLFDPTSKVLLVLKYQSFKKSRVVFLPQGQQPLSIFILWAFPELRTYCLTFLCVYHTSLQAYIWKNRDWRIPSWQWRRQEWLSGQQRSRCPGSPSSRLACPLGKARCPDLGHGCGRPASLCPLPPAQLFFCFSRAPVSSWRSFQQI